MFSTAPRLPNDIPVLIFPPRLLAISFSNPSESGCHSRPFHFASFCEGFEVLGEHAFLGPSFSERARHDSAFVVDPDLKSAEHLRAIGLLEDFANRQAWPIAVLIGRGMGQ